MSYWQLRCAEMKQRSAYLYQSGLWSDCSFKLGEEEVIVKAHKLIMAMASPVFGKLFYGREAAKNPVPIYDTRPEVFRILLEYIYSDHINLTNVQDACDLHNAAFNWGLPYVKEMCIKFISSSLNADNVWCIYELACQSKELHLQDDCIKIFKTLTKEILKAESFKEAKLSTVLKIFSMDTLNIDSELDLFKAAVNHAAAQDEDEGLKRTLDRSEDCFTPSEGPSSAKRSRIDSTGLESAAEIQTNNDTTSDSTAAVNLGAGSSRKESHYVGEHDYAGESSRENDMTYTDYEAKLLKAKTKAARRETYRDLMRKIRFLTLTPQEFAECTTLSFLLPNSAIMALSLNISSKDTFVPMPKHFSTSMVPRNLSQLNERERQAGATRITVNNIRNLKKFESNPFYIRNLAWTLMLMHLQETAEDINRDVLIIAVTCFFEKGVPEWIEKVEVRVSLVSENYVGYRFQDMKLKTSQPCNDYGAWIIKKEWIDLMSAHGIIEDNTVTCKVHVSTNIQKSPTSPDSSPDNSQTEYITTPLRSSTPVSRARYLKEKTQKQSDLTASGLSETRNRTPLLPEKRSLTPQLPENRSLTPLLPEKRSLTPLLPEKRSLTPLLPEKRSLTPLLPEKRSLTPLLPEKCSTPSPLIEKRSLTPLLHEKRSVTPSQLTEKRSLTPILPDKRLPPILPEKRSGSPLIEKHGVAKTPGKRNLSPLPEERNITPPPVENQSLPPRPKKRYLTQSQTEKLAGSPEKSSLTSPLKTSNLPIKNVENSSPLPPNHKATPSLPEKHMSTPTPLPINTKSPISSQATVSQSIPAPISSPSRSEVAMRSKHTVNTVCSPQTLNSPVVGLTNRNFSDPSIETLKLSVSNKDKPRALTCVQILRSLHRKGYPMNGSIAQRYLNELSAMSINGFQVLRPLLAYANASAATNGSGHIVPAIMEKKRDVVSPTNSANSASQLIDDNNTKSVTKPDQKKNEPLIMEPIPRKDNVSSVSQTMAIIDDNNAIFNPSAPTDCTDSINEQNMKQLATKPFALKDDEPSISEPIHIKDTVSFVPEPMAVTDDVKVISNPSALMDGADSTKGKDMKQLAPKPLALKDDEASTSKLIPINDNVSSVSEPMVIPEDITALSNSSALTDCTDSVIEQNMKQLALALKDNEPSISEPMHIKDTVSSVSDPMVVTDDVKVISNPSALMDGTVSIKDMKHQAPKSLVLKDDGPSTSKPIPIKDIASSVSEPMALTGDIEVISSPSAPMDCTDSINEQNMKQLAPKPLALKDDGLSISEPIPMKDNVSVVSESMARPDNVTAISNPTALMDSTDSIKEKDMKHQAPKSLALEDDASSISEPIPIKDTNSSVSEPMAITASITVISNPSALIDCTDSINENNMKQQEPIPIKVTYSSVSEPMIITDDITGITRPSSLTECTDSSIEKSKQLSSIPHAPKDNEPLISEPIPIKDSSVIVPLITTDDLNSTFKPSSIAASSISDPLPLKSLALLHSNVSIYETSEEEVLPKSPGPVISEPMHLNDDVSLSEPMALNDDFEVPSELSAPMKFTDSANVKDIEQLASNPSALNDNEPWILEPMCLKEVDDTNSVSELSSIKNAPSIISEKSEAESSAMDGTNTVLEQSADEKNKQQITLKTLVLRDIPLVSDPNLKDEIPMVPQSLNSSVDEESALKLTASNNSSSISDSRSLKYDDSVTSEVIDLFDSANSSLKRDSIENPLDAKKDTASSNSEPLLDDNIFPTPIDLMESVDIHPESHTVEAQLTLCDTEPSKSEPLALNDTIILDAKPVADTATASVSNTLVLNDNLSSTSKPMDLMEIFDTISELRRLKAQLNLGDNEPSKSIPLTLNDTTLLDAKSVAVPLVLDPLVLNDNVSSTSKPMDLMEIFDTISELHSSKDQLTRGDNEPTKSIPLTLNDTTLLDAKPAAVLLVSNPLVLNDNLSSTSKPMDLMEIFDTISEFQSLKAHLTLGETVSSMAPNDNIPLETKPVTVKDKVTKVSMSNPLTLSVSDPLADTIPSVSNTLTLNDNLSSVPEAIYLKDSADVNPESHSADSQLTFGHTESSKSEPLAPIHTIPSDSKPVALNDITTLSKPFVFIENVPSALDSSPSHANSASEPMDITDSNIEPLTTEVLTQSDTANLISETMELKEEASSVSKDIAQPSKSAFDDKDSSLSTSKAILKCRRNLMTLKHLKYPMNGTLAQKYLKTLKELTNKPGSNVTTNLDPKSKPSTLIKNASMPVEVDESKQTLILINRQILMSLKSLKYPMSGPIAQKHLKALTDLTNKTQHPRPPHTPKSTVPQLAQRSKEISAVSPMSEMKKAFIIRKIIKYKRALMTLKFHKYPMTGLMAQKYIKAIGDLTKKIDL